MHTQLLIVAAILAAALFAYLAIRQADRNSKSRFIEAVRALPWMDADNITYELRRRIDPEFDELENARARALNEGLEKDEAYLMRAETALRKDLPEKTTRQVIDSVRARFDMDRRYRDLDRTRRFCSCTIGELVSMLGSELARLSAAMVDIRERYPMDLDLLNTRDQGADAALENRRRLVKTSEITAGSSFDVLLQLASDQALLVLLENAETVLSEGNQMLARFPGRPNPA